MLLPLEIRLMIYRLLLTREKMILVCSPRKRSTPPKFLKSYHFGAILRVNKQIYLEASPVFFSANTFGFRDGPYGSTDNSNMHGVRAFVKRIPAHHLSAITKIELLSNIPERQWERIDPSWIDQNRREFEIIGLRSVARILSKHLKGLRLLKISEHGNPYPYHRTDPRHTIFADIRSENAKCVSKIIQDQSKHGRLEVVQITPRRWLDVSPILGDLLNANPGLREVSASGRAGMND